MTTGRWLVAALIAGLIVAPTCVAVASYPTPEESGHVYSVVAGAAFPVSKNVKNSTMPTVGVSWYGPAGEGFGGGSAFGITGDWVSIERIDGKKVNAVPVFLNFKRYTALGGYRIFVNLGAGVIATTDNVVEMDLEKGVNFGWTGGLGLDFSSTLLGQVRYIGGKNPGDDGLVAVQLGYRF